MSGWLDTPNIKVLEKGLDATSLRQRVLANNISNVDTPDFKSSDVDFATVLGSYMKEEGQLALKTSSPKHFDGVSRPDGQAVVEDNRTILRNDGNNVDVEQEMTKLAENSLQYSGIARAITEQFTKLRTVIQAK